MDNPGFDQSLMEGMLSSVGQHVAWQRSSRCPCRSLTTGGADPRCLYCKGAGYVWEAIPQDTYTEIVIRGQGEGERFAHPIVVSIASVKSGSTTYYVTTDYTLLMDTILWVAGRGPSVGMPYVVTYTAYRDYLIGVSRVVLNQQFAQFGEWEQGDMIATVPARDVCGTVQEIYGIGDMDRVTLLDSVIRRNFVGTRGQQDVLLGRVVRIVMDAFYLDSGSPVPLAEGIDFRVTGNVVEWLRGTTPDGTAYSLRYIACPECFVWKTLEQPRAHDLGLALPKKVILRSFDLFGRDK